MAIHWKCSSCGRKLLTSGRYAGRLARCPRCNRHLTVPQPTDIRTQPAPTAFPIARPGAPPSIAQAVTAPSRARRLILAGFLLFFAAGAALAWAVIRDVESSSAGARESVAASPVASSVPVAAPVVSPSAAPAAGMVARTAEKKIQPPVAPPPVPPAAPTPEPKAPPPLPPQPPVVPVSPQALSVASSNNVIMVRDSATGKELWQQTAAAPVVFLAFGPDGTTVISRDQKGETCTWDTATGKLLKRETAPTDAVVPAKPAPKAAEPALQADNAPSFEELRAELRKVKELDFHPLADQLRNNIINANLTGRDFATDQRIRNKFSRMSPPQFLARINDVLLKEAAQQGLPLLATLNTRLPRGAARTMDALSKELRSRGFVSLPGAVTTGVSVTSGPTGTEIVNTRQAAVTPGNARVLEEWCQQNRIERYPGALDTFVQMLQVEDDATRLILVKELGKVHNPLASQALARRAVFDLSPQVRQAAIEQLRPRKPETYQPVLFNGLRYPWAPAATHAAEALTALQDKAAMPELVALLSKPDPRLPYYDPQRKIPMVAELVRLNHMRNCFLCHAASGDPNDLVRGAVPRAGQALPRLYYRTTQADFVKADATFLRQDFSVAQKVDNAFPWPTMQRYDYLVRRRKATATEIAELQKTPAASYPQRDAVLDALRKLSGRDLGPTTVAWQKYADELALADKEPKSK